MACAGLSFFYFLLLAVSNRIHVPEYILQQYLYDVKYVKQTGTLDDFSAIIVPHDVPHQSLVHHLHHHSSSLSQVKKGTAEVSSVTM